MKSATIITEVECCLAPKGKLHTVTFKIGERSSLEHLSSTCNKRDAVAAGMLGGDTCLAQVEGIRDEIVKPKGRASLATFAGYVTSKLASEARRKRETRAKGPTKPKATTLEDRMQAYAYKVTPHFEILRTVPGDWIVVRLGAPRNVFAKLERGKFWVWNERSVLARACAIGNVGWGVCSLCKVDATERHRDGSRHEKSVLADFRKLMRALRKLNGEIS